MIFSDNNILTTRDGVMGFANSNLIDFIMGDNRVEIDTRSIYGQIAALKKSSVVQTAIKRRANAFGNLNVWAKDEYGRKVINDTVKKDLEMIRMMNPYQSFRVFNNMAECYAAAFGTAFVYKLKLAGFDKYEYYILPNNIVTVNYDIGYDDLFNKKIKNYTINVGGKSLTLESDEVYTLIDNNFSLNGSGFGLSRMIGLREPISTLLSIGETATQLIADGGARGIIGQGARDIDMATSPFINAEKDSIQEELKKYGGLRSQLKYIVIKGAASYVPLTSKIIDMQLSELAMDSKVQIFEQYGIPNIFAAKETRYKSLPEARKEFYTGTIIPEATDRFADIMRMVGVPYRDGWQYQPDWSHMDFFQESLKESAIAFNQAASAAKIVQDMQIFDNKKIQAFLEPYLE